MNRHWNVDHPNKRSLTDHDIRFWISDQWPLTVVMDRYGGCYSGGRYTAWPLNYDEMPEAPSSDDVSCAHFWDVNQEFVGIGNSMEEAVRDL
jgi:hypothetical protein